MDRSIGRPPMQPAPVAWLPVVGVVAAVAVTQGVIAARYGWHRDEFYYVATGRRLAWGYVDQPPLTPLLARLAAAVGDGVVPLRVLVIAFRCATLVLGALIARELSGGRRAQTLAAGCVAGCAVFVGASLFLGTTPTDQFFWALIIWCTLRALRVGGLGAWGMAGLAAGTGFENKHTVAILLIGMLAGLVSRRRSDLRGVAPLFAAGVAAIVAAPNVWWDATHHWESLNMASVLADKQGGILGSIAELPLLLILFPGPLIMFVLVRGLRSARREPTGNGPWLLVTAVVVVVLFTLAGGKPYYSAPMFAPFFALGAVAIEHRTREQQRTSAALRSLVAGSVVAAGLISLPYLPPSFASMTRSISKEPMETYGWPDFARQVADASSADPQAVAVYVSNYGEAGALRTFGKQAGLGLPVVAGQNAYRDWGPPSGTPTEVIAVGEFDRSFLLRSWSDVEQIAKITLPSGLHNEETANDAAVFRCSGPLGTWQQLWHQLSYLN